ncbi:ABC transporter ATP-binding protein [Deinococcus yavapaiensis]|uniref:ABC-2 type transport system ATP-binding protein n=1 Tax=Deinococcus yavapaiensis KR-236 TaxID=694435 RepID=A0A318S7L9_9DEIO|nr:ABC transporter ATP-binding protein [Deinococcus yavapaiensis]PYE51170.1 ABC-2 type transport system ATP-binding protein [Deinococcus yavapaiensis KR-236]
MSSSEFVIKTRALTRQFGGKVAVDHLDLTVKRGEVFGLLGHNGAGKTTTVRLLNGVLAASSGSVRVFGLDPVERGDVVRRRTGVLTETPALEERLTPRENLGIFADLYGVPIGEVKRRVDAALRTFDLAEVAASRVSTFSKGMKQRLAIARATLHAPEVLYLDEPTSGLDPVSAKSVNDAIVRWSRDEGRTVLLCTHDLRDAERLCDRVAVLSRGKVVLSGVPAELSARYETRRVEITVHPEDVQGALRALARWNVEATGAANLAVEAGRVEVPAVLSVLLGASVRVYEVHPHAPTLEDVYFAVHGVREAVVA